jgi:hypothetical protein
MRKISAEKEASDRETATKSVKPENLVFVTTKNSPMGLDKSDMFNPSLVLGKRISVFEMAEALQVIEFTKAYRKKNKLASERYDTYPVSRTKLFPKPCFHIHNSAIVLFSKAGTGMVIYKTEECPFSIGEYRTNWNMEDFSDFNRSPMVAVNGFENAFNTRFQ